MNTAKAINFAKDSAVEKKIAAFLDQNFYSSLSANASTFGRSTELSDQYAGIDLSVGHSLIDEKSKNTSTPNQIRDYYASLEIYHLTRSGEWTEGWFANPNQKTTHYFFEYRFEDDAGDISSVIIVSFNKAEMKKHVDQQIGYQRIINDASAMRYAKKHDDDVYYKNKFGFRIGKLTKSPEGAAVLTFKLTDLERVKGSHVIEVKRGRVVKKLTFDQLRQKFTK